jgi:hypothetical protein
MVALLGLPCHIRKVICDVSEEGTASVFIDWMCLRRMLRKLVERNLWFVQEESILLIGQNTPNFLYSQLTPSIYFSTHQNQTDSAWRRSQRVLPEVSESLGYTVWNCLSDKQLQLWKPENLPYKWTFHPTCCMSYWGDRSHWPCELKWQRNKVSLSYIQTECPSTFVTARSALFSRTLLVGQN